MKREARIAFRFAQQVLVDVPEFEEQNRTLAELKIFAEVMRQETDIRAALTHPGVPITDRVGWMERALVPHLSAATVAVLRNLVQREQLGLLSRVVICADQLREQAHVASVVTVTSAKDMTREEEKRIRGLLEQRLGMPAVLERKTDSTIGGGLRLETNDWYFDSTVRGRAERLTKILTA